MLNAVMEMSKTTLLKAQHEMKKKRASSCTSALLCSPEQFLAAENAALRRAGCKLAEAALHVAREYDGVHRLMLAVSEWAKAVADEGGRGKAN